MVTNDDLLSGLLRYGRGQMQDRIVRSTTLSDAVIYLQAEFCLEMARVMSFRTEDFTTFEKAAEFAFSPGALNENHESTSENGLAN